MYTVLSIGRGGKEKLPSERLAEDHFRPLPEEAKRNLEEAQAMQEQMPSIKQHPRTPASGTMHGTAGLNRAYKNARRGRGDMIAID